MGKRDEDKFAYGVMAIAALIAGFGMIWYMGQGGCRPKPAAQQISP